MAPILSQQIFYTFDLFTHLRSDSPFLEHADTPDNVPVPVSAMTSPTIIPSQVFEMGSCLGNSTFISPWMFDLIEGTLADARNLDIMDRIPNDQAAIQPLIRQATARKRRNAVDMSDQPPFA